MLLGLSMFSLLKTSLPQPFDLLRHPNFASVLIFLVSMSLVDLYGLTKVVLTLFRFGILMWHLVSVIFRVIISYRIIRYITYLFWDLYKTNYLFSNARFTNASLCLLA